MLANLKPIEVSEEANEVLSEIQQIHARYTEEISDLKVENLRAVTDLE